MPRLPVIIAQGGVSSAGRTSGFHGYRRLVFDCLNATFQQETVDSLMSLMNLHGELGLQEEVLSNTLIRQIDNSLFNTSRVPHNTKVTVGSGFTIPVSLNKMTKLPNSWQCKVSDDGSYAYATTSIETQLSLECFHQLPVSCAGQLPTGFEAHKLYQSRNHPKALAMTVYGASDALLSSGLDWGKIKQLLSPDQVSVYAGCAMGQLDYHAYGGMMQARLMGRKITSKQCPFGFSEMSADFINAYVLGGFGSTGTSMGACASMLYNLKMAVNDICSGRCRLAIVGNSEAPICPEVIEGYGAMGALVTDGALRKLDNQNEDAEPFWRTACRPFSNNAGFVIAESAQFLILMDDELAMQTGAQLLGSVADVFINADGYKKSISSPGVGNYLTFARAVALGQSMIGSEGLKNRSYVQSHGTGTPKNRVTESHILETTAKKFAIKDWRVTAIKSHMGHSLGAAGGDQIMTALGAWHYGILPKIANLNQVAEDVYQDHLNFLENEEYIDPKQLDAAFINAKGFGGNNATALLLSPEKTKKMLMEKHGKAKWIARCHRYESIERAQDVYESDHKRGCMKPIYHFGQGVIEGYNLDLNSDDLFVDGYGKPISLDVDNPYW